MPREVFDVEEFIRLSERAKLCKIKRLPTGVKLKLRTPRTLYTLKVENSQEAEELLKRIKCSAVEV